MTDQSRTHTEMFAIVNFLSSDCIEVASSVWFIPFRPSSSAMFLQRLYIHVIKTVTSAASNLFFFRLLTHNWLYVIHMIRLRTEFVIQHVWEVPRGVHARELTSADAGKKAPKASTLPRQMNISRKRRQNPIKVLENISQMSR